MTSSYTPGYRYLSYNFGDTLELEDITWNGKPGFGAVQQCCFNLMFKLVV